jgi:glucose-6-phosphate isomerase
MLTLDFANCLSQRVGEHGLDPARVDPQGPGGRGVAALSERLKASRGSGMERWRDLPLDPMRSEHLSGVKACVEKCKGRFENLVVLGIGGSALGNIAVHAALADPMHNLLPSSKRPGPRLFVLDNVDPVQFASVMRGLESLGGLEKTLFNVISKSGETAETAAQFMIVRDRLQGALGDKHREHIVAITDPVKGTMREICDRAGYATLPVPDGVGGRFSVLSPVGLFSAAMCGIDVDGLLEGAAAMDGPCASGKLDENPAAMLAVLLVELASRKGKSNHVLMPYCNGLALLGDWWAQLWAESLGKRVQTVAGENGVGYTPIRALGATDQHSQVQLYREGPNDKAICFVEVETFGEDVAIPKGLGVEQLGYLEGRSLSQLLKAEKRATEFALVQSGRPNLTIQMPRVDAHHVGQFIYLWEMATAYAGGLLGIDAYDQPAVELGKQATFGLMGRGGFEDLKVAVEQVLG